MEGSVVDEVIPQSFEVRTEKGVYRRNRRHLIRAHSSIQSEEGNQLNTPEQREEDSQSDSATTDTETTPSEPPTRQSKRASKPPERLDPSWT